MTRIVFFGTPLSAVPSLEALDERYDIGLVISQPDRPRGRSKEPMPPPVKLAAETLGADLVQPTTTEGLARAVSGAGPFDLGVVVAYGRLLRPEILEAPQAGVLNVHFSLLPRWRGAAPVARALMAGDTMTGITIIRLDEGLDTGPVLTAQALDIADDEDAGRLTDRLSHVGARLLAGVIDRYVDGQVQPVQQVEEGVTYAEKIEASDRPIDISGTAVSAIARIRGLSPLPAATLEIDDTAHKILEARVSETDVAAGTWTTGPDGPVVGLADGAIELRRLQPAGRRAQSGEEWLRGRHRATGIVS